MPANRVTVLETDRAEIVLSHAKLLIKHFREALATVQKARNASGPPTAGEQDLIRALAIKILTFLRDPSLVGA